MPPNDKMSTSDQRCWPGSKACEILSQIANYESAPNDHLWAVLVFKCNTLRVVQLFIENMLFNVHKGNFLTR